MDSHDFRLAFVLFILLVLFIIGVGGVLDSKIEKLEQRIEACQ